MRERRELPGGEVVEWFHLVADFSAAEALLRERVARLAKFQHVKFSRILGLEPSGKGRGPILVSSHLGGSRLAEVLEMAGHGLVTFDTGAGLHVTREVLGGLAVLHDSRTVSHGTLAPERIVLTPNGRVVMVEHVLGPAIDRLQRPRHQLWREWRIPTPPGNGQVRLDIQADLAQAGLVAMAALLGRPVDEEEYPHRLRGLLPLIQDRLARSPAAAIAGDVVAWLERLAPLDSRRAFTSAREAQQAYEALVAGGATAMGLTSARVKGVVAAVAALAPAPAADQDTAQASPAVGNAEGVAAVATSGAEAASVTEEAIDIEALLRLEAELEGGNSPGPDPVTAAVRATRAAPPTTVSLETLEQERRELQQQFASLVDAVAPPIDAAPVHLIPETPPTSEPLVDERVRWSSMPAADLTDVPATPERSAEVATEELDVLPTLGAVVEDLASGPADEAVVAPADPALAPVPLELEHAELQVPDETELLSDELPFRVEPIVVIAPVEPAPSAAIEHVPADWWREALPWRDEDHAAPVGSEALGPVAGDEPQVVDAVEEVPPVGEHFGYLTLDAIEARASRIGTAETDEVETPFAFVGDEPATLEFSAEILDLDEEPLAAADEPVLAEDAVALAQADARADVPVEAQVEAQVEAPVEEPVEEPVEAQAQERVAEPVEVQVEEPVEEQVEEPVEARAEEWVAEPVEVQVEAQVEEQIQAPVEEQVEEPVAAQAEEPVEVQFQDQVEEGADTWTALLAGVEPQDESTDVDTMEVAEAPPTIDAPVPDPEPAAEPEPDPYAKRSSSGLFGDLRPIMLQDLEPVQEEVAADGPLPLADAAPLEAASSLFTRADAAPQEADWRHALLGTRPEATPAPDEIADEIAAEPAAGPMATEDEAPTTMVAAPALSVDVLEVVAEAAPVAPSSPDDTPAVSMADPAANDGAPVPELVVVDDGSDGHAWDQLSSEAPVGEPDADGSPAVVVDAVAPEAVADVVAAAPADAIPDGEDRDEDAELSASSVADEQAGTSVARRKRRRSRRKKAAPAAPVVEVPPVTTAPAPPVVAPVIEAPAAALVVAPVLPPDARDPIAEKEQLHAVSAVRPTSLLEREVPRWTPPADLGALRPRATQPTASEMAAPAPAREPATDVADVAHRSGGDDWGTGSFPSPAMASGEMVVPARPLAPAAALPSVSPVTAPAAPAAMPTPVPVAPVLEIGASEAFRPYEPEIRAVGLPDLEDLDSRSARIPVTTAADLIGAASSARPAAVEPRVLPMPLPEVGRRGMNWRRLMAAAALITLFNGAAFAAWWWVQPGARGTLVVETGRSGVEVLVDGAVMGRTPFRGEVKPGRHTLRLRLGGIVREMPVEISDGVVTTQTVDWLPGGGGRGALQVSSNPSGAELFFEGKSRGKTPLVLEDLPEGDQQLTIRSEAGIVTTTATVVAGETTPIEVKVFAGWVLVDSEYEVELSLNGKKIGASMDGQILLPPGPYRLRAENRSLGIDQPLTFTVEPGAVTRLSLKVSPAYYEAPEGAEVIIDGTSVGSGPGRISITPGTHDVVVRNADGSEKHFSGIVRANRAFEP
ncbi:PEGA domain-containing protein [Luteitalea sp. TBR-22]|uniref:PEGA domain-containing protein n=1 Tax=Luteitalea sp. TBR-22 TaxID=2802971 RepID=UPI001EF48217|nr:PEGA domain-containing protein [Luteitalea sp. TBR-22]